MNTKTNYFMFFLLIPLLCAAGCEESPFNQASPRPNAVRDYGIVSPTLSPDNSKILFVVCKGDRCYLAIHELSSKRISYFNPTDDQSNGTPIYSPDGKFISFASGREDDRNIYVMNADGSNVRQLTHDYNKNPERNEKGIVIKLNGRRSFSPDAKRIIFIRSGIKRQRSMGGEMVSHWDIWEIDVSSGVEKRLTDYRFYSIGRPFYLPDGKRFIFSGIVSAGFQDYEKKYKNNHIYIMDGVNNELRPIFLHGDWTSDPSVANDGSILFIARTNFLDGTTGPYTYDLFLRKNGKIERLTNRRFSQFAEPCISFDGKKIVFLASKTRGAGPTLFLMNGDGSDLHEVDLPLSFDKIRKVTRLP